MIDNFSPQPYPLWATWRQQLQDDEPQTLTGRVIGWEQNEDGVVIPVIFHSGTTYTLESTDGLAISIVELSDLDLPQLVSYT